MVVCLASFAGMEGVASYFQLKCLISNNRSWDFMDFCMIIVWSAMVEVNGGASDEDRKASYYYYFFVL